MFWLDYLGLHGLREGEAVEILSTKYKLKDNILRQDNMYSHKQLQTGATFAFKWNKRNTYESDEFKSNIKKWLIKRYLDGDKNRLVKWLPNGSKMLDAGCGSVFSSLLLFESIINRVHYLGVDISESIDTARDIFEKKGLRGEFLQADLLNLPFSGPTFDFIFSEGALHHTDSTEKAIKYLSRLLLPGGRFLFYVYRKKAPIREFCDDYIRNYLKGFSNQEAWDMLRPLTKLGKTLGSLNITIEISEEIPYLEIPKGRINLQRLFYWYFCKAFYRADFSLEEMNHINFDWYRPLNCHRHTPQEIKQWCKEAGLFIEMFSIEESGITCIARKGK